MAEDDFELQLKLEKESEKNLQKEYIDPNDGTKYEWNAEKQAWFPKIDEDFLASYLSNYGETSKTLDNPKPTEEAVKISGQVKEDVTNVSDEDVKKMGLKRKANESEGWFEVEEKHNTNVYVSGLPNDITEDEFTELMGKCGIIMKDPEKKKLKIKLYTDSDGNLKGDGRCCYIKVESVELALNILDGADVRGHKIHVERAQFQMRGSYDPKKKPKKKRSKDKQKQKQLQEKLFDWRPELQLGERLRHESTVIIKNMFDIAEFDKDAKLILEYQADLREECSKYGEVKKVKVYDRHLDGVAAITFKEPEEADECIGVMNGRWFGGRRLSAKTWDGKTKYTIHETEEQLEARIKQWDEFLDQGDA